MSFVTNIDTTQGDAELKRLVKKLDHPRPFLKSWAQSSAKKAQANSRAKGGRRFWSDFARRIRVTTVTDTFALVENDHYAANIKQYGGEIRPKNARALTIPVSDEAKGKRAGEFETGGRSLFTRSVFLLPSDKAETIGVLGYSDEQNAFHPLFVLRTKSVQKPDPWWPTDREIMDLGIKEARWWVERQLRK